MSLTGIVTAPAAQNAGTPGPLPLSAATGGVRVEAVIAAGGTLQLSPDSVIYTSAALEVSSVIPAAALPACVTYINAHVSTTAVASYYVQMHSGVVAPAPGTRPLFVSAGLTAPGAVAEFDFGDNGLARAAGYIILLSTTEDTLTDAGVAMLFTTATGKT